MLSVLECWQDGQTRVDSSCMAQVYSERWNGPAEITLNQASSATMTGHCVPPDLYQRRGRRRQASLPLRNGGANLETSATTPC